jgi:DNA-binding protein H-NS
MKTSKELRAQAAELIRQAEEMEKKERDDAREAIMALMRESGLTPADFQELGGKGNKNKGQGNKNKSSGTVAAQFKDPESGKEWSGRGRAPEWIKDQDREKFRITANA